MAARSVAIEVDVVRSIPLVVVVCFALIEVLLVHYLVAHGKGVNCAARIDEWCVGVCSEVPETEYLTCRPFLHESGSGKRVTEFKNG